MADNSFLQDSYNTDDPVDTDKLEILIEAVRTRPALYQETSKDYKKAKAKELLWEEISEILSEDVEWCKTKWRYLRDNYRKKKTALKGKSGDSAKKIKKWTYFDMLTFLNSSMEDAETSGNVPTTVSGNVESEENEATKPIDKEESAEPEIKQRPKKRSKVDDPPSKLDEALVRYIDAQEEKDSNYYFAMSIAQQLKCLPISVASYAKMKISQIMYEVEHEVFTPSAADVNYSP